MVFLIAVYINFICLMKLYCPLQIIFKKKYLTSELEQFLHCSDLACSADGLCLVAAELEVSEANAGKVAM